MPHAEQRMAPVAGQKGHLVIQEDGTIISSSGDLSNNQVLGDRIIKILKHSLPLQLNNGGAAAAASGVGAEQNESFTSANGNGSADSIFKWSRLTISFPDHSYIACLSNRKINIVKRANDIED